MTGPRLHLVPVAFADACAFVTEHHRHHRAPVGMKFCVGVATGDRVLRGVAIVGRPVARSYDDGRTPCDPTLRTRRARPAA